MRTEQGVPSAPEITGRESFDSLVRKLSPYFIKAIETPHTFEELRTTLYARTLKPLVGHLVENSEHPATVSALLVLKAHFAAAEASDDRGIYATRGVACEIVAWRFVTHLTEKDAIDYLCYELPLSSKGEDRGEAALGAGDAERLTEETPLLQSQDDQPDERFLDGAVEATPDYTAFATTFEGLSALEIAAVCDAKKFLAQKPIQRVIDGIWKGHIVFWDSMSFRTQKQVQIYNPKRSDPFCRLKVPLYLKMFEVLFFFAFLAFYYVVLVQKSFHVVTTPEIMLYIWLASFAYNELGEFWDAGFTFYVTDFWSLWDLCIIATGAAFFLARVIGLTKQDAGITDVAFDILSVEALFLVPRMFSLVSLHPYFGTLIPCLKEMTKDFIKFLGLVAILYLGFNTTFAFLARGTYSFRQMNWILVKVFFGSSYLGFDVAEKISPILGPPLMFVFVCLTNILLITSLISLLSNSLTKVMEHARDEYLFVYSVYVLEASTSNRLTYFIPPLNLISLLLRPLRLCLPAETLRQTRIFLLKATHSPFVALILAYEKGRQLFADRAKPSSGGSIDRAHTTRLLRRPLSGKSMPSPLSAAGTRQLNGRARSVRSTTVTTPPGLSAAPETVEALENLISDMKSQLHAVGALLEREKARVHTQQD